MVVKTRDDRIVLKNEKNILTLFAYFEGFEGFMVIFGLSIVDLAEMLLRV